MFAWFQEGRDKAYLLKMLQDAHRKNKTRPQDYAKPMSPKSDASGIVNSMTAPGKIDLSFDLLIGF